MSDPTVINLTGTVPDVATMSAGPPGPAVELRVTATHIQWKLVTKATWNNLIALSELEGEDGVTPTLQAGAVTTGAPGTSAAATLTETTPGVWTLALTIPRGATGARGNQGIQGVPGVGSVTYSMGPGVFARAGAYAWRAPQACSIESVAAVVTTAPAATAVVVDLLVNGVSAWTLSADRPSIAVGATEAVETPDTTDLDEGDLLTVDVAQGDDTARCLTVTVHLTS